MKENPFPHRDVSDGFVSLDQCRVLEVLLPVLDRLACLSGRFFEQIIIRPHFFIGSGRADFPLFSAECVEMQGDPPAVDQAIPGIERD